MDPKGRSAQADKRRVRDEIEKREAEAQARRNKNRLERMKHREAAAAAAAPPSPPNLREPFISGTHKYPGRSEVCQEAFEQSGLPPEEWNALPTEEKNERCAAVDEASKL